MALPMARDKVQSPTHPLSSKKPSTTSVRTLPPTSSLASNSTAFTPLRCKSNAQVSPAMPPPTMITSASFDPADVDATGDRVEGDARVLMERLTSSCLGCTARRPVVRINDFCIVLASTSEQSLTTWNVVSRLNFDGSVVGECSAIKRGHAFFTQRNGRASFIAAHLTSKECAARARADERPARRPTPYAKDPRLCVVTIHRQRHRFQLRIQSFIVDGSVIRTKTSCITCPRFRY